MALKSMSKVKVDQPKIDVFKRQSISTYMHEEMKIGPILLEISCLQDRKTVF